MEIVEKFFAQLVSGMDFTNRTIGLLRNALVNSFGKVKILSPEQKKAYLVQTWNAYISGRELRALRYDPNRDYQGFI